MSKNLIFVDIETTGLDPISNGIVQISMLFEKDGEVIDIYDSNVDCTTYTRDVAVNQIALDINGIKIDEIESFLSVQEVVAEISAKIYKNYGKTKVKLCGYNNTSFDKYFIEEMYKQTAWDYDNFFHYKQIDVFEMVKGLQYLGLLPQTFNQRLETILEEYKLATIEDIKAKAHNSLWDVHMTRELFYYIQKELKCS